MKILKSFLISLSLLILFLFFPILCFSQDEIIIRTFLLEGFQEGSKLSPKLAKAFSEEPPKLPMRIKTDDPAKSDIDSMREVIGSVYRIPNVILLTTADMRWDGKSESINETVLCNIDIYPIQIYPKIISQNEFHIKIEAFKFEFERVSFIREKARTYRAIALGGSFQLFIDTKKMENSIGGERWLDKELDLAPHAPALIALPTEDRSIFLALEVVRKDERRMDIGFIGNRLLSCIIGGTDPVCGKKVRKGGGDEKENELRASIKYKGETYLFCSEECLAKFSENPDKYLKNVKNRRNVTPDPMLMPAPKPKVIVVPEWPAAELKDRWDVIARLNFDVDGDGSVLGTRVYKFVDVQSESALQETLGQWAFEPKIQNGKPVSSTYPMDLVIPPRKTKQKVIREDQSDLVSESPGVLARMADYCSKLEKAALYFICWQ